MEYSAEDGLNSQNIIKKNNSRDDSTQVPLTYFLNWTKKDTGVNVVWCSLERKTSTLHTIMDPSLNFVTKVIAGCLIFNHGCVLVKASIISGWIYSPNHINQDLKAGNALAWQKKMCVQKSVWCLTKIAQIRQRKKKKASTGPWPHSIGSNANCVAWVKPWLIFCAWSEQLNSLIPFSLGNHDWATAEQRTNILQFLGKDKIMLRLWKNCKEVDYVTYFLIRKKPKFLL